MENQRPASTVTLSRHLSATNVNDAPTRKSNMDRP